MSKRIKSWNTFETQLDGGINNITETMTLLSVDNLSIDTFLVIDPDTPAIRDFVFVTAINGTTKEITVKAPRPEEGSFGGIAHSHDDRAVVRAVPVHQWLDAIFDDIEDLEAWDAAHAPGTDPHPQYLNEGEGDALYRRLNGANVMAADMNMGDNQITNMAGGLADDHAANLLQVQTGDTNTLAAANAHSDSLDHDHATPIGVHAGNPDIHHAEVHIADSADHTSGSEVQGRRLVADGVGGMEWADSSGGGVTDHGALTGLGDDDHTQYHTNARGDARYYQKSEVYTKAQVDSLLAGKAPSVHTHTAAQVTPGSFPTGNYTFLGALGVAGAFNANSTVDFSGLAVNAGGVDLRLNGAAVTKSA